MRLLTSCFVAAATLCAGAWAQSQPAGPSPQAASPHPQPASHGNLPQPAIIVDADALIRAGQRANAVEEAAARPKPAASVQQPAVKKKGVHLSTGQPLPLSTDNAGQR